MIKANPIKTAIENNKIAVAEVQRMIEEYNNTPLSSDGTVTINTVSEVEKFNQKEFTKNNLGELGAGIGAAAVVGGVVHKITRNPVLSAVCAFGASMVVGTFVNPKIEKKTITKIKKNLDKTIGNTPEEEDEVPQIVLEDL